MNETHSKTGPTTRVLAGVLAGIAIGYAAGYISIRSHELAPESTADDGTLGPLAEVIEPATSPAEYQEQLMALGYSAGTELAPERSGVTVFVPDLTYGSYNVFASAHAPTAHLIDMNGNVLHQWAYSFHMLWPDTDPGEDNVLYWRRLHLFENGDILAIIEPHGIFKLDKDSNLLWEYHCGAHHDMYVAPNGHIFVLSRKKSMLDDDGKPRPILEDFIVELDAGGNELRRVSIVEALLRTPYASLLKDAPNHWDILHTNAIKHIDESVVSQIPAFKPGRFLLSLREIGTIAVLDMDSGTVEWAIKGQWFRQHESTVLDSGNILLFDNKGHQGRSKVIEFDPVTQEIAWSYGMREDQPLDSPVCGLARRVPNGNTLITEAVPGRVIEVTPAGEIVWEYINPNRVVNDPTLIATFMDFQRLPAQFEPKWSIQSFNSGSESVQ
jgi:hypothetical protein